MTTQANQPRSAMQVMPEIRGGELIKDLTKALLEVTEAVLANQKNGKIVLTLAIKPGNGADNALVISDSLKITTPKPAERGTIFFADDKNSLTRNDPNQLELQGITVVRHAPKAAA
ncbi:hypothetical protein UFOVP315_35 [uncultured Caudovirales phage]|uniref:Uncharacterized protein n=1 Tax=uncultured Caudovirales phage TaxID=2100421 RepID=A0A6J5LS97_9CAUD|nr:hypothetical protein UFOVP315_35 [uncultured Caudovirales phage]